MTIDLGLEKPITTSRELSKQYSTFAGTDTRVRIDGKTDGQIQAISIARQMGPNGWEAAGTIIRLLLDSGAGALPDHIDEIEVVAANEYGKVLLVWGAKDVDIMAFGSGVSIDDIVLEEQYTFIAKEFIPGRRLDQVDLSKLKVMTKVHTKHCEIKETEEQRLMVKEALELTKDEPSDFLTDLSQVLDRHGITLLSKHE